LSRSSGTFAPCTRRRTANRSRQIPSSCFTATRTARDVGERTTPFLRNARSVRKRATVTPIRAARAPSLKELCRRGDDDRIGERLQHLYIAIPKHPATNDQVRPWDIEPSSSSSEGATADATRREISASAPCFSSRSLTASATATLLEKTSPSSTTSRLLRPRKARQASQSNPACRLGRLGGSHGRPPAERGDATVWTTAGATALCSRSGGYG
jgi:hypothetical protein